MNFFKMDRIWKSKSTFDPSTSTKPKLLLPNQISCRIIGLEIEIEDGGGLNKETIIQLLHEYTVNCFLTSRKLLNFLKSGEMNGIHCIKKMQKFLQKPAIDMILKGGKSDMAMKKQETQEEVRKSSTQNQVVVKKILECSEEGVIKQK